MFLLHDAVITQCTQLTRASHTDDRKEEEEEEEEEESSP
jgi:hypothetical protein